MNKYFVTVVQDDVDENCMTFQVNNHDLQSQLATALKTDPNVTQVTTTVIWEPVEGDVREEGILDERPPGFHERAHEPNLNFDFS